MSKKPQASWMDETPSEQLAATFATPQTRVTRIDVIDGKPGIVCKRKMQGTTTGIHVRLAPHVFDRLKALTDGHHSVAASALIENALCQIEAQRERWVVSMND